MVVDRLGVEESARLAVAEGSVHSSDDYNDLWMEPAAVESSFGVGRSRLDFVGRFACRALETSFGRDCLPASSESEHFAASCGIVATALQTAVVGAKPAAREGQRSVAIVALGGSEDDDSAAAAV